MSLECRDRMSNEESHSEIFANQVVRTYNELNHTAPMKSAQSILNGAATTVNYAPMLSVLFLGTRMRALQLSGNPAFLQDLNWNTGASANDGMFIDRFRHAFHRDFLARVARARGSQSGTDLVQCRW